VVLDALGSASVWLGSGTYKFVLTTPTFSTVWTADGVNEANLAGSIGYAGSQWIPVLTSIGLAPIFGFISSTSFTVNASAVNLSSIIPVGQRIQTTNTGGTVYSTVASVSFGAGVNTFTVINDGSGVIDSGISALFYGATSFVNPSYLDPRTAFCVTKNGNQTGFAAGVLIATWTVVNDPLSEWTAGSNSWKAKYSGNYLVTSSVELSNTVASIVHTLVTGAQTIVDIAPSVAAAHHTINTTRLQVCTGGTTTVSATLTGDANTTVYGTNTNISIVRIP
jgi:hypothetical protein